MSAPLVALADEQPASFLTIFANSSVPLATEQPFSLFSLFTNSKNILASQHEFLIFLITAVVTSLSVIRYFKTPGSLFTQYLPFSRFTSATNAASTTISTFSKGSASPTVDLLPAGTSNLSDQHTYTSSATSDTIRIKSLFIYPIKSCRGIELNSTSFTRTGFQHDRQFVFALGPAPYTFITQRSHPKMALIKTSINGDQLTVSWPGFVKFPPFASGGYDWLNRNSFSVPLSSSAYQNAEKAEVKVWQDKPNSYICPLPKQKLESLARFLEIKKPQELVFFRTAEEREVFRCAPRKELLGWQPKVRFQDSYPVSIMNLASVRHVAESLKKEGNNDSGIGGIKDGKIEVQRFRPNVIFEGPAAFEEDHWKEISLSSGSAEEFTWNVSCRTTRCKLPNTNQETGVKHPQQPDRLLRSYRCVDEGAKGTACLGMMCVPLVDGQIKVGDEIRVGNTGEHFFLRS
ncbi:MOSC N-terminal beta barrel domain-containing protein [Pyronema omphalodes]|nr:MOSC N-terminal beta barrel domain-containing protein [Pyronema omphalodes]